MRNDFPNETAALQAVAEKLDIGSRETLRNGVKQYEIDAGARPGTTTEESAQLNALKENSELKRANEILKAAASFFASMSGCWRSVGRARATRALVAFIDEHRDRFGGVGPICRTLTGHDCKIAPLHLLPPPQTPEHAVGQDRAGHRTQGTDHQGLRGQLPRLRGQEDLVRAEPAGTCGGPLAPSNA
nr:hypothetical protein [Streptomyces sp. MBT53]